MGAVSAVVITKNEEHNIERCLKSLGWVDEIIVVDDLSTDRTVELAEKLGARVIPHKLKGFGEQKNIGIETATSEWILNVDADEVISEELRDEIIKAISTGNHQGYTIPFRQYFLGRAMRNKALSGLRRVRLARRDSGRFQGAVHELWQMDGPIGELQNPIIHYGDRTYAERWTKSNRYSTLTAEKEFASGVRVRWFHFLVRPLWRFLNLYFRKHGFRDGIEGLIWSLHGFCAEVATCAQLWEMQNSEFHPHTGCTTARQKSSR